MDGAAGARFTCFTGTKVQILTGEAGQTTEAIELGETNEYCDALRFTCFTCFTSTKVHILTGEVGQTTEAIELKTEYCDAVYLLFFFFCRQQRQKPT